MDFSNRANPVMDIYKEMFIKLHSSYLYHTGQKNYHTLQYMTQNPQDSYISPGSSIDDILTQDSRAALDKIKNTALNIAYRIKINNDFNYQLDYNWYTIRKEILSLEPSYIPKHSSSERRRSTLISELFKVYKNRLDEQVQCWRDLQEPMRYFINLFHQYKGLKQDKKLLEEK